MEEKRTPRDLSYADDYPPSLDVPLAKEYYECFLWGVHLLQTDDKSKGNANGAQDECGEEKKLKIFLYSSLFIQYHLFNIIVCMFYFWVVCVCFYVLFLFWMLLLLKAIISKGLSF